MGIGHFFRATALADGHNLPGQSRWLLRPSGPAAAPAPNRALIEVQGSTLPAGISADWVIGDGRIILGTTPTNGLRLDESAVGPPVEAKPLPPDSPHARPADAGLRMTLHG